MRRWWRRRPADVTVVHQDPFLDQEVVINDRRLILRDVRDHARNIRWKGETPWEQGMAHTILYLIDRIQREDAVVHGVLAKWQTDRLEYPLDDGRASTAFLTVKMCEDELRKAWEEVD